ncbi:MAG TPA: hypothetical protein VFC39_01765 [Acidobacteriaceae bacterium]|nr:hypothetical protein [Acidobacteriaceae bacterium]
MAETTESSNPTPHVNTIDPNAPAGSPNSLGAESVRDGRPATGDNVVEAMDEEGPAVPPEPGNPGL